MTKLKNFFTGNTKYTKSEPKLNPQKTININISNYEFIHNDPPTNAGGWINV